MQERGKRCLDTLMLKDETHESVRAAVQFETPPISQNRTRSSTQEAPASRTAPSGDHRPEAIAQRQWPGMINRSPRVVAQAQWRVLIDHSPRQVAQRQRMEGLFRPERPAADGRGEDALQTPTASATPLQAVIQRYPRIVSGPTYSGARADWPAHRSSACGSTAQPMTKATTFRPPRPAWAYRA